MVESGGEWMERMKHPEASKVVPEYVAPWFILGNFQ